MRATKTEDIANATQTTPIDESEAECDWSIFQPFYEGNVCLLVGTTVFGHNERFDFSLSHAMLFAAHARGDIYDQITGNQ